MTREEKVRMTLSEKLCFLRPFPQEVHVAPQDPVAGLSVYRVLHPSLVMRYLFNHAVVVIFVWNQLLFLSNRSAVEDHILLDHSTFSSVKLWKAGVSWNKESHRDGIFVGNHAHLIISSVGAAQQKWNYTN